MKRAIVIQGAPAVGKSTLATRLGKDLGLRIIMKDAFKEALYDTAGIPGERNESMLYGRIAIRAMYGALDEFYRAGLPVIIEAPLDPVYARDDLSHIMPLDDLLLLHVTCDPRVQEERFRQRIETAARHDGHGDLTVDGLETQTHYQPIEGIDTIEVDTTYFSDQQYGQLLAAIHRELQEG